MQIFFQADGGSTGTPETTPATSSAPMAPASTSSGTTIPSSGQSTGTQESPFSYSYKFEDGKEFKFGSKAELDNFFRGGVLRHDNYTKKTQELSESRKALEAEQKRIQEAMDRIGGMESKWKPIDEFMAKHPEVMQEIIQKYKGKLTPKQDDSLRKELEELKNKILEKEKKSETEERRKKIYSWMSERYEDFDSETVDKSISQMLEAPEGDELTHLVELVYWANKGRMSPAQIEASVKKNLEKKQAIKPAMTSSGNVPNGSRAFKSLQEAAEAAKARYG